MRFKCILILLLLHISNSSLSQTFLEGFNDINTLSDWYFQNNSTSANQSWHQGSQFDAYEGAIDSYLGVGYQSSSASNAVTLSNWAISPSRTFNNGDIITFYTRHIDGTPVFPDRLELRLSEDGNNLNVGFSEEDVGTFSNVLLTINPSLTSTGYPNNWTQYTVSITGLSGPTNGRLGFRYYVTNGGPGGNFSNYIGIDSFTYFSTLNAPPNDECENAISLDHDTVCTPEQGSLQLASQSIPGCDGYATNDVWYSFTASSNASAIELTSSSEMDAVIEIYSGSCSNLNSMVCINSTYDGETEAATLNNFISGQNYFIRVYDWYDWVPNTMDFTLCIESFEQCDITPGVNSYTEDEVCGNNVNGGCFVSNPSYQDVSCNETYYGTCWAENGIKDYDWYRFEIFEPGSLDMTLSSEFPVTVDIYNIDNCSAPQLIQSNGFNSCEQNEIGMNIVPGIYAAVIQPTTTSDLFCGNFNEYEVFFSMPESTVSLNISGMNEFCEGSPLEVYTDQIGGDFDWITNGNVFSNSDTLYLDFSGDVYVNYTNQNGCSGAISDTLNAIMNPLISAQFDYGSLSLCRGDGIAIPDIQNQGVFSTSAGLDIDPNNGSINIDNSDIGSYTITHETNGICPDSVSIELNISTYADISFTLSEDVICDTTASIELNATPIGGVYAGPGIEGAMFDPSISGTGIHIITYSYDNIGCISSVEQSITVENCSSVNEIILNFMISPNPCNDEVEMYSSRNGIVRVYNSVGEELDSIMKNSESLIIDTKSLKPGVYYVWFFDGQNKRVHKLIKH